MGVAACRTVGSSTKKHVWVKLSPCARAHDTCSVLNGGTDASRPFRWEGNDDVGSGEGGMGEGAEVCIDHERDD